MSQPHNTESEANLTMFDTWIIRRPTRSGLPAPGANAAVCLFEDNFQFGPWRFMPKAKSFLFRKNSCRRAPSPPFFRSFRKNIAASSGIWDKFHDRIKKTIEWKFHLAEAQRNIGWGARQKVCENGANDGSCSPCKVIFCHCLKKTNIQSGLHQSRFWGEISMERGLRCHFLEAESSLKPAVMTSSFPPLEDKRYIAISRLEFSTSFNQQRGNNRYPSSFLTIKLAF
jgi:hypothetical protein